MGERESGGGDCGGNEGVTSVAMATAMAGTQVTTSTAMETGPLQYSRVKVGKWHGRTARGILINIKK